MNYEVTNIQFFQDIINIDASLNNAIYYLINKMEEEDKENIVFDIYNKNNSVAFSINIIKDEDNKYLPKIIIDYKYIPDVYSKSLKLSNKEDDYKKYNISKIGLFTELPSFISEEVILFNSLIKILNTIKSPCDTSHFKELKTKFLIIKSDENNFIDLEFTEEFIKEINSSDNIE